jgi:hypothetical protein
MIGLVLRTDFQHFLGYGRMFRSADTTGSSRGGEGESFTAVAFDHDALGAPPVDEAQLHFQNLVVRFGTLDNPRHRRSPSFPRPLSLLRSPQAVGGAPKMLTT